MKRGADLAQLLLGGGPRVKATLALFACAALSTALLQWTLGPLPASLLTFGLVLVLIWRKRWFGLGPLVILLVCFLTVVSALLGAVGWQRPSVAVNEVGQGLLLIGIVATAGFALLRWIWSRPVLPVTPDGPGVG